MSYDGYGPPTYRHACTGFETCMTAVDLLFNEGPDSLKIPLTDDGLVTG